MDLLIYKKMGKIEKLLSKLYKKKDLMMELEKKKIIMVLELLQVHYNIQVKVIIHFIIVVIM